MPFRDRTEAGQELAAALEKHRKQDPIVLALPRAESAPAREPLSPAAPRPAARAPPRDGTVTVNGAVACEISTACFCNTRRSSACAPGRRSSAGRTYAAGPSVLAFRTDRLLF